MTRPWSLFALCLLAAPALAQDPEMTMFPPAPLLTADGDAGQVVGTMVAPEEGQGRFRSNRNFSNFVGFMSNPLQNIDPRALTQVQPIFGSAWVTTTPALPDADFQLYGPAMSVALTERLCAGVNQGGYAAIHVDRVDPRRPLVNLLARTRGQEFGGSRTGFLNIGAFAQYTLIEDVPDQFLLTGGLRVIVPCGAYEVFQGQGPTQLVPYLTAGKEVGQFHFLGTAGYQFPAGGGGIGLNVFNVNAHVDREFFGWLYPLAEVNCNYHTQSIPVQLDTRVGYFDFGNFTSAGNIVTLAVGANAVLVRDRLEFGAVYTTVLAAQRNFDADSLLVKLTLRY